MDFTKDRLSALQAELNGLEIEINKETQKSYAHLTVEEVEKYLLTKVFEDPNDIKTRKLLVNTFIREIIWYENKLVITYNFHENAIPERPTKSHIEDIEMQIKEASRSAFSFSMGSHKFRHSVGHALTTAERFSGSPRSTGDEHRELRTLFGVETRPPVGRDQAPVGSKNAPNKGGGEITSPPRIGTKKPRYSDEEQGKAARADRSALPRKIACGDVCGDPEEAPYHMSCEFKAALTQLFAE